VQSQQLAGLAAVAWRGGRIEHSIALGCRDLQTGLPMERDTIFRIASMSKPVTTLAALMLLEEGRFALDEPIEHYAPELRQMRVLRDRNGPLEQTEAAHRLITFDDLLTHRSGLTYGDFHYGPIASAYAGTLGGHIDNRLSPDEWIQGLATLPLVDQPGAAFHYGHSTDLLGFLIARMEAAPLGEVLARRIFIPLGMADTGFAVPSEKRSRRAGLCGFDTEGRLSALAQAPGGHALAERPHDMTFESGGQGLWSTLDDYLKFARIFIGGGAVDDVRLVRPETLALMASNRLTPSQRATSRMFGSPIFATGHGYGMGVAVVMEPENADPVRGRGGAGTVGWPGAYGGWWQADPADGSVFIFLTHNMVGLGVWEAIAKFHESASA